MALAAPINPQCTAAKIKALQNQRDSLSEDLYDQLEFLDEMDAKCDAQSAKLKEKVSSLKFKHQTQQKACKKSKKAGVCKRAKSAKKKWTKAAAQFQENKLYCAKQIEVISEEIDDLDDQIEGIDKKFEACGATPVILPTPTPKETPTPVSTPQPALPLVPPITQCNDGIDNDGDSLVDLENDPGCSDASDTSESSEGDLKAAQVSQWGITFQFDKPYHIGQFANGDWWVAPDAPGGQVKLTATFPAPALLSGYSGGIIHGWQVNPSLATDGPWQGLDVRANFYKANLMPTLPYLVKGGDAIFKAISDPAYCVEPVNLQCLSTAAVLTVVDQIPSQRGAIFFRPSYLKGPKKFVSINDMHWELIPSLQPPSGVTIPSLASVNASIERVQNDWLPVHDGRIRAKLNTPSYGADISARNNEALFRLFLNDPLPQKKQLAISLVQYGLDLYATYLDGQLWQAVGGHGFGRMVPITFAGTMLQDNEMKAVLAINDEDRFGEVSSTYINPTNGKAYYGEDISSCHPAGKPFDFQYWDAMRSHGTARMCRNPYPNDPTDGGERVGALYQTCCSSGFMQATYIAFHLMPSLAEFYYDEGFMKYVDRWIKDGPESAQDTCAPAVGTCDGGDNDGTQTTSALGRIVCTGFKPDGKAAEFKADMSKYMISFGNNGTSECIKDTSPFDPMGRYDGFGRFPFEDGFNKTDWGMTPYQKKMQEQYFVID